MYVVSINDLGVDSDDLPDGIPIKNRTRFGVHPQGETKKIADSLLSSMPPFQCRRGKNASVRIPRE